jgi:predicted HNH restriction endonuclease
VVDRAWVFEDCAAREGDRIFVCWHDHGIEKARLAMRGVLLSFSPLGRSPIHHRPGASLRIRVTQRSTIGQLLVQELRKDSDFIAERELWRKLTRYRWTKIACLDRDETDFLRHYFDDVQDFYDVQVPDDVEAEEGYLRDKTGVFLTRNRRIVAERKEKDSYKCQACGFRFESQGKYVIDCHHIDPLAGPTVTNLNDLVCLCPTCHRIAHTRKFPLRVEEIRATRKAAGLLT